MKFSMQPCTFLLANIYISYKKLSGSQKLNLWAKLNILEGSVQPKLGFIIGNQKKGLILVSVSQPNFFSKPKLFFHSFFFKLKFFLFSPTCWGDTSLNKLENKPRSKVSNVWRKIWFQGPSIMKKISLLSVTIFSLLNVVPVMVPVCNRGDTILRHGGLHTDF